MEDELKVDLNHECYHFACDNPATGLKLGRWTRTMFYACDEHRDVASLTEYDADT
jgi:hypothetical protein